jgi:predicted GNAT superfamily acetyltransferase
MTDVSFPQLVDLQGAVDPGSPLLALNNAHAEELSLLDAARMRHLIGEAFMASRVGPADALLLAFDQDADYDSPNFVWFRDRYEQFVYVDRVVVDPAQRGRGLARRLYEALFARAAEAGHTLVVCEVNAEPPNPASDAFHAALGFGEVGSAVLAGGGKTVRYFARRLTA